MKWLLRGSIGLVLAIAVLALAVELLRARLAGSEALRESLVGAAAAQLDVRLEPGPIDVQLRPPALLLASPVLELADGARVDLPATTVELAPGSLLAGVARVTGVSMAGAARLRRERLELAGVVDGRLLPAADAPGWSLEADVVLERGGRLALRGGVGASGGFVGEVALDEVEAAPFAVLLASDETGPPALRGSFDGRLLFAGADLPATLRIASAHADLALPPVSVSGPVALVAELPAATAPAGPAGRRGFAIDASQARVEYLGEAAGGFTKASGRGASVEGSIVRESDGRLRLEDVSLRIQDFQAERRPDRAR